ncbi:hypothetical protein EOA37_09695 [Mesorhizobium sp. M2A.F.Ca.ET.015.02.1.1]|uniref:hypothetical protein n=1 Tax=Mesorhizobium sp. M2A.F.Ca.ET.015.02.1.1 TaxID=2496758 RepID=UPI000FCC6E6D|nr:hypothetical protein [Mesorhizobium sp. M2A.F.Ca.ET.015.02.1.1]RUW41524.1 hypothetical protein EOA37_09695 [Mesorhizobium sp. M2A.F.Ca.ET.015.02.1.1]
MSWSLNKAGRASKLAEVIKQSFADAAGAPKGSDEEAAKNQLGEIAETLCRSFSEDKVVRITAQGSAWNENGKAKQQYCEFKFETLGDFVG